MLLEGANESLRDTVPLRLSDKGWAGLDAQELQLVLLFIDADMTLGPQLIDECLSVATKSGARGVIIPEISVGEGFLARCRALEQSCYAGDDAIEAARFYTRSAFEASAYCRAISGVRSEEWLSTTTSSTPPYLCDRMLCKQASSVRAVFRVGTTTETRL